MFWKIRWFFYCQGSGSALIKFWGSEYDQCGSATLFEINNIYILFLMWVFNFFPEVCIAARQALSVLSSSLHPACPALAIPVLSKQDMDNIVRKVRQSLFDAHTVTWCWTTLITAPPSLNFLYKENSSTYNVLKTVYYPCGALLTFT